MFVNTPLLARPTLRLLIVRYNLLRGFRSTRRDVLWPGTLSSQQNMDGVEVLKQPLTGKDVVFFSESDEDGSLEHSDFAENGNIS